MKDFTKQFISRQSPGDRVLDLGAGKGNQAKALLRRGCFVVAIDRLAAPAELPGLYWQQMDIKEALAKPLDHKYNGVLMNNVIQFLPQQWIKNIMIPNLIRSLEPGAMVSITTFYRPPLPAFKRPHTSYWTVDELKLLFPDFECLDSKQGVRLSLGDFHKVPRLFRLASVLLQAPL